MGSFCCPPHFAGWALTPVQFRCYAAMNGKKNVGEQRGTSPWKIHRSAPQRLGRPLYPAVCWPVNPVFAVRIRAKTQDGFEWR